MEMLTRDHAQFDMAINTYSRARPVEVLAFYHFTVAVLGQGMRRDAFALTDTFVQTRTDVINPNTPLAFLPPTEAGAHEFLRNFWAAVAAVSAPEVCAQHHNLDE